MSVSVSALVSVSVSMSVYVRVSEILWEKNWSHDLMTILLFLITTVKMSTEIAYCCLQVDHKSLLMFTLNSAFVIYQSICRCLKNFVLSYINFKSRLNYHWSITYCNVILFMHLTFLFFFAFFNIRILKIFSERWRKKREKVRKRKGKTYTDTY